MIETPQANSAGQSIQMTLGWHVGKVNGETYFFKEGDGGGFHSEMRIYPAIAAASVVMVNATDFNSRQFLNRVDQMCLNHRRISN